MLSEMIKKMETKAPEALLESILEFKKYSWKPLNSYVHGGLHVIDRHSKGYPVELLEQALKASNGLNGHTGIFAAVLAGDRDLMKDVHRKISEDFSDCFQMK